MTETMIPFTEDVLRQMMTRVLDELIAHGLLEFEQDEAGYEKAGDQFMELLREQGLVDDHNGIPWDDAWSCQAKTTTCRFAGNALPGGPVRREPAAQAISRTLRPECLRRNHPPWSMVARESGRTG